MMFRGNQFDEKNFSNTTPRTVVLFSVHTNAVMVHIPAKTTCLSCLILPFLMAASADVGPGCQISKA
jgi:hypothetical protein